VDLYGDMLPDVRFLFDSAVHAGQVDLVQKLLQRCPLIRASKLCCPGLAEAAWRGNLNMCRLLLRQDGIAVGSIVDAVFAAVLGWQAEVSR
jgi:hypothetical protein